MLLTPPPTLASNDIKDRLEIICNKIETISNKTGCYFVDINNIFSQKMSFGGLVLNKDGVHPNIDGQNLIARSIYAFLKNNGIKKARIVCFGDSITYGVGADHAYPCLLQVFLN